MDIRKEVAKIAEGAKGASRIMGTLKTSVKNDILKQMAASLITSKPSIMAANRKDLKKAEKDKRPKAFVERLFLDDKRIEAMAEGFLDVAKLEDPVGAIEELKRRPNGLVIGKMRVPLGVICIIYESRPNVTADCIALSLKSGNSIILRGGSDAIHSNVAIFESLNAVAQKMKLPKFALNIIRETDRKAVDILLDQEDAIDVIIPRGGESLIREVTKKSKVPVIKHYKGVCHLYIDEYADLNMAEAVAYNAKVQRPGVCNAMETLLVHKHVAARFLPSLAKKFTDAGVEIRGCPVTKKILKKVSLKTATAADWRTEYLDLIVSIKVVDNLKEAIDHIAKYGTRHSDGIVTDNYTHAMDFLEKVDSSAVYVNASTRFTDGNEFGKGAEMGISTDKLHARGPMGVEELTTYKYVIFGKGQIRT